MQIAVSRFGSHDGLVVDARSQQRAEVGGLEVQRWPSQDRLAFVCLRYPWRWSAHPAVSAPRHPLLASFRPTTQLLEAISLY